MKYFKFHEHLKARSDDELRELKKQIEGYPDPIVVHLMIDEEISARKTALQNARLQQLTRKIKIFCLKRLRRM